MTTALTVTDLTCRRGEFTLGPVGFDVPAGGRVAIVGPSGSGKTSLLRCVAGLERIGSGTIRIGDQVVADGKLHTAPDRRGLGLVFQDGALWPHLNARQHLTFAAPSMTPAAADALLERGGIGHLAERKPAKMSGGEAQRLGLLRALAPEPAVLLLDEPLRSVDVHLRDALVLLVRTLADERGLTTVLVTHDRDEAFALATDLVVMHEGRVVERGSARELLANPSCAFTAAFLANAACLPTTPAGDRVETPFGAFDRPAVHAATNGAATPSDSELRLVLLPGDVSASPADDSPAEVRGSVLTSTPTTDGYQNRIALGDHIVFARSDELLATGLPARLNLRSTPRLLPWQTAAH
ncbi:MAG: ABC transporter ATP-binding protein [bacterium]|nr:ABC transporter ATP-binding protein [bacterium]